MRCAFASVGPLWASGGTSIHTTSGAIDRALIPSQKSKPMTINARSDQPEQQAEAAVSATRQRSPTSGERLRRANAEAVPRITRDPLILDFVELAESARSATGGRAAERHRTVHAPPSAKASASPDARGPCWSAARSSSSTCSSNTTRPLVSSSSTSTSAPFRAEFAGKMNLYVNAVNELIAQDTDSATVGFILCTDRDKTVAQLTLQGIATPIAITRYTIGEQGDEMTGEQADITEGIERG